MSSNCGAEKLLRVPGTAKRSNQSILKEIIPEYSLEGLLLKLQYFGHLMWRADSSGKTLMLKDWRQGKKGMTQDEMVAWHHWLNQHEFEQTPGDGKGQGSLAWCSPWGHKELDMTATELIDWYVCLAVLNISCGMWDLALWLGIKPRSPALRARSLTTGPPGKSWVWFLARKFSASMID